MSLGFPRASPTVSSSQKQLLGSRCLFREERERRKEGEERRAEGGISFYWPSSSGRVSAVRHRKNTNAADSTTSLSIFHRFCSARRALARLRIFPAQANSRTQSENRLLCTRNTTA